MNIFALRTRVTNKILVLLALVSLILTSLPVGVLTAFAANSDAVGTVTVDLVPNPSATTTKESVEITFDGTGTLNLFDWELQDSNPTTYTFGAITLTDGQSVKICSGAGDVGDCDITWTGSNVWNNDSDTLNLLDENGLAIVTISYVTVAPDEVLSESTLVNYAPVACTPQTSVAGPTNIQNTDTSDYFNSVEDALDDCDTDDGDTISLLAELTISEQITLDRPIILNGGGFTISPDFTKTDNDNNSSIGVQSDNVTIENLTIDGIGGTDLHGINVYVSTNVEINDVTIDNPKRTGVVVNGSEVTVHNLTTSGSTWHAINAAPGSGVTEPTVLTVTGTSVHAEDAPTPHIYTDDTSKVVTINDTNDQYEVVFEGPNPSNEALTAKSYRLKTVTTPLPLCSEADSISNTTFDTFSTGDVDGQNNWKSTGSYDQEVVDNTYGYASFGCKSLRISNAVTTGGFGDQTFAAPLADSVGETDATAGSFTEGTRYNHYEVEFDIASTKPSEQQSGLAISVSPDRGDGSRMSYLSFSDVTEGIAVTFYDVQGSDNPADFIPTSLDTLDRSIPHTVKFVMDMVDGASNDVVQIYIDGSLVHTGTSWENYFRFDTEASAEQSPRLMKTLLLRSAGTAVPANDGNGFLFDNMSLEASNTSSEPETPAVPTAVFTATPSNTEVLSGGYTQEEYFTFDLSSSPDVTRYQLKYWNDIVGSSFKEGSPWNPTDLAPHSSSLGVYNDHFTQGEGTHYFAFSACNSSDECSEYSSNFVVTYDTTAPTIPVITAPTPEQIFASTPISNQWTVATDASGIENYQIAYGYDDEHTFGGSTCPDVTIDDKWVGCRDLTGTSRNHSPSPAEQGGVTIWVRAFDNAGNASDWSEPVHYYYYTSGTLPDDEDDEDNEAPAVPTGLAWTDSNSGAVSDGGTTALESGTATWDANTEEDFSHYIYKYWNNIESSPYNDESSAWTVNNGTSNSRGGSFNQGEGTHYFCVVAVDTEGNESDCSEAFTVIYDTTDEGGGGEDEDFGTLEVTKTVSGTIPEDVTGEFVITITCDNSEYDTTFTLTNGQSTSTDIADGVTCTVSEDDAQGATVTYTPDATVTMEEGVTEAIEVTNTYAETLVETSGGGGGGSSSRRSNSAPEGEVLGASTSAGTCGMYLLEYMALGNASNAWEVMKLQLFLASKGLVSATSGVFDLGTESSVKQYQADNSVAILDPWVTAGLATELAPTGNVYKTTRWHINNAVCPGSETFPVLP